MVRRANSQRTANKNWPDASWDVLIPRLCQRATVIELGQAGDPAITQAAPTHIDLTGRTSLDDLVAAIAAADLYVGPMSGPAHIAAAAGTPGVVIYGGYEPAAYTAYPGRVGLATHPSCSPCWLSTSCPYDLKCLRAISPAAVEACDLEPLLGTKSPAEAGEVETRRDDCSGACRGVPVLGL